MFTWCFIRETVKKVLKSGLDGVDGSLIGDCLAYMKACMMLNITKKTFIWLYKSHTKLVFCDSNLLKHALLYHEFPTEGTECSLCSCSAVWVCPVALRASAPVRTLLDDMCALGCRSWTAIRSTRRLQLLTRKPGVRSWGNDPLHPGSETHLSTTNLNELLLP